MISTLLILPVSAGLIILSIPGKFKKVSGWFAVSAMSANLLAACSLIGRDVIYSVPWAGYGIDFSIRLDNLSALVITAVAAVSFLVSIYSVAFLRDKNNSGKFFAYLLISLSMINGAVASDNLVLMLFFWEGLLITLFAMIMTGGGNAYKTAVKALVLIGISDLCMMSGIGIAGHIAGTLTMSQMRLCGGPHCGIAFLLLALGAIAMAGVMPFHSWIPDAAADADLPFMAVMPAALGELLGAYFLIRICFEIFSLMPGSWMSALLMLLGSVTIILAAAMALVQYDYKKSLSYIAVSQAGYVIFGIGIGTAFPPGIAGVWFLMLNYALFTCCLFLTAGAVERGTGTTDIRKLGGLAKKFPVTSACFIVSAFALLTVSPLLEFFFPWLSFQGARIGSVILYSMTAAGSFLTAAALLKLGHSVYFGGLREEHKNLKEAPALMLAPMMLLSIACILLLWLFNPLPIFKVITSALDSGGSRFDISNSVPIISITALAMLAAALINHIIGVKKSGSAAGAADHIRHAPGLSFIYDGAEKKFFDPYEIGMKFVNLASVILFGIDRVIDRFYQSLIVNVTYALTGLIRKFHNGDYSTYLSWSLSGFIIILIYELSK